MRSTSVSAATQRRKQEEQNALAVRKILSEKENKFCFECGERGPTYINLTIGSTCCAHCSGLLRGLNPPHRVKSISMSTFTADEVERLKTLGNAVNSRIYLGLYDGRTKFEPRVEDEVRTHLIDKYENKRWYVSPSDVEQQKRLLDEHAGASNRRNSLSGVSTNSQKSNQSAPAQFHFAQQQSKPGPIDLLTGDLFDLNVSSSPQTPQPSTPASVASKSTAPTNDWSLLFDTPAPPPPTAFPLSPPQVPAALKFPAPTIPPPKPKDTLDDLFSVPSNPTTNPTTSVPQTWEVFTSTPTAMSKSATVGGIPSNQLFDDFFGLEGPKPNGNPKPRPPVPASMPVASSNADPFGTTPTDGNPPIQWPSKGTEESNKKDGKQQWNPFL